MPARSAGPCGRRSSAGAQLRETTQRLCPVPSRPHGPAIPARRPFPAPPPRPPGPHLRPSPPRRSALRRHAGTRRTEPPPARPGTPSSAAAPGATTRRRGEAGGEAAPRCLLGAVVPAPPRAARGPPLRTACPGGLRAGRAEGLRGRGGADYSSRGPGPARVRRGVGATVTRSSSEVLVLASFRVSP